MRLPTFVSLLSLSLVACVEVDGEAALGQADQDLHGPSVVASGPISTGIVRFHGCAGCRGSNTLVRQDMVLTNKHVVDWTGAASIYVQFGDAPAPAALKYQVTQVWHSPTADLALLKLQCSIHTSHNQAVPLSTSTGDFALASSVTLAGYGPTSWTGTDYGIKRSAVLPVPSTSFTWGSSWSTSGLAGSAPGDSGGSLYFNIGGVRKLGGVITWGSPTDSTHYTAGQRIDANLTWLQPLLAQTPAAPPCPLQEIPDPPQGG